ncbi:MAG: hypothetical protein DLM64_11235 [Solirubrobacterales bacterium]|nr:MAG: hypothetical protein DLM64_11235 [Solirubrobacterales bacterium]
MRIGYSCWGFLGPGVTDTPDGGRSHRRTLVNGLIRAGHDIVFLQANRDLTEASHNLTGRYTWDSGLPEIDALFLEWRWPIPGRNITACGTDGHTCDLHRQVQLVTGYTRGQRVPTVIWDKDLQLPPGHPLRGLPNVAVCEPALLPGPGAASLLFPVADAVLDAANPVALAAEPRPLPLVYIGNQYDRDGAFGAYFAPAAARFAHLVAGKWTDTSRWPHLNLTGRCPFSEVSHLYRSALATVLLLPDRYARAGQMTQRLFEAVLAGCLPITPASIACAGRFTPPALHAADGQHVIDRLRHAQAAAGTAWHVETIAACLERLGIFRLSRQIATLNRVLERLTDASCARLPATSPRPR